MHKIRITKLKDPNDVGVINLAKVFAVRKKATTNEKESVALAIYYPGVTAAIILPQSTFKFEFVQIAMNGVVHYTPTDIDTIVATFAMLD